MNWIFQAIPKRYDLRKEMKEGHTETWLVTRYRDEMSRGDIVFFWLAGPSEIRGLYGWGQIIGKKPKYFENWGYGIEVKYKKVFPTHISSSKLQKLPNLSKHVIFKMAVGTNFNLTDRQADEIKNIIISTLGKEVSPNE